MDEVVNAHNENENLRKVRIRLLQWDSKVDSVAAIDTYQEECIDTLKSVWHNEVMPRESNSSMDRKEAVMVANDYGLKDGSDIQLPNILKNHINNTSDFLAYYNCAQEEMFKADDSSYSMFLKQLGLRYNECDVILHQICQTMEKLDMLNFECKYFSEKTRTLNNASEQLIKDQQTLQQLSDEVQRRLYYFNQVDLLYQVLQSPTISVASEAFTECIGRIDEGLQYLSENPKFKDCSEYTIKYRHCLSKAISLIKNYVNTTMSQATETTLHPKHKAINTGSSKAPNLSDAAFALYYGKYQTTATKIKRISQLVEARVDGSPEYKQLLLELHQNYFNERATIMSPAVNKAIQDLRSSYGSDHCSLMRSACAFLVHVCQDEQRLYFQFFVLESDQLKTYLEGLCTILYDTMRPFIIHINHLETLAEICSILRIEMLEEHVQQNPQPLEAFANAVHQLLQDVQERLVFRAHLYLQSDILGYNPSSGDLAYPDKLEMMERIAISLQEQQDAYHFQSNPPNVGDAGILEYTSRARNINSPADLHGMWYPTVRRTLVCLSRLYRCVDRPVFQGLSQEAIKLCVQSVSAAASKISTAKTPIDGELFEIKHLLILREQIAPFRVDFTVKETSLDFSKMKTAAMGLLQKRKQLFSLGSNNALLAFLLDGTPQVKEHLLDSRKEVDRQLKMVCEQFIKNSVRILIGPVISFLERVEALLATENKSATRNDPSTASEAVKINYALRQSAWANPQQICGIVKEAQRLVKIKLPTLQRSMQLYLSNRDTEFIIFRPIRNNIIQSFVKLEQVLSTNGYTTEDMAITSCPSAEQISILLSSASILAVEGIVNFTSASRRISNCSNDSVSTPTPLSTTGTGKQIFDDGRFEGGVHTECSESAAASLSNK